MEYITQGQNEGLFYFAQVLKDILNRLLSLNPLHVFFPVVFLLVPFTSLCSLTRLPETTRLVSARGFIHTIIHAWIKDQRRD